MTTKAEIRAAVVVAVAAIDELKSAIADYSEDVTDEETEEVEEFGDDLEDIATAVSAIGEWFAD